MATSIVKILRVVADPNRLRILLLLKAEELSVAELQEILVMGQSTISTHLSQLKQAGLVEDRRIGKNSLYSVTSGNGNDVLADLLARAQKEIPEAAHDRATARRVVKKRQDKMRAFFDSVAGRLGKDYVPGKSWKSVAEALLRIMPPMVIADLGTGDHIGVMKLMANALVDGDFGGGFGGYAGGGVGRAWTKYSGDKDSSWAYQGIAGVRYAVTPNLDAGVKYEYFRTGKLNFDDAFAANGTTFTTNAKGHYASNNILASLVYNFNSRGAEPIPAAAPAPPPPPPEAPATQTCPDGSVILATSACPAPPAPPPPPPPAQRGERG